VKRLIISCLALSLLFAVPAPALPRQQSSASPATSEQKTDVRQETFNIVWETIKEKHWDLGSVDWDGAKVKYEPLAVKAESDAKLHEVLQRMLGELHQSHFQILPRNTAQPEQAAEPGGWVGIDIRSIGNQAVISRVEPGSAAAEAGIRAGFVVTRVGKVQTQEIVDRYKTSSESEAIKRLRIGRSVLARLSGAPGTTVEATVLDEKDNPREVKLTRHRLKGEMSQPLGNFAAQYTEFEAKRLEGGIGYIRFNVFVMILLDRIRAAIRGMSDAPGIIIDLRGNPGGVGGMAQGIAGVLEQRKEISLGVMKMRRGYQNFVVFPQPNSYAGPVVILQDGGSGSTSEIFAAGMQESGRAKIVGERSMGAALPSVMTKLPTGAVFQYAVADYRTPTGVLVEGKGVAPDLEIKLTRKSLLEGRDVQLDAAVEFLRKQGRGSTGNRGATITRQPDERSIMERTLQ
jgi:carboxyl-terminal processing protease